MRNNMNLLIRLALYTFISSVSWNILAQKPLLAQTKPANNSKASQGSNNFAAVADSVANSGQLGKAISIKNKVYSQQLEQKVRNILSQQLDNESFFVSIKTQVNRDKLMKDLVEKTGGKSSLFLKTLGSNLDVNAVAKEYLDNLSDDNFQEFISKIDLNITFDKRVSLETQKILQDLAKQAIEFSESRGDVINAIQAELGNNSVKKIQEKLDKTARDLAAAEEARARAENNLNAKEGISKQIETQKQQLETQKQQLEKAKFDAESAVRAAQADTDRAKEELKNAKLQIDSLQQQLEDDKTPLGKLRKQVKGFELLVTFGPIALVLLIALGGLAMLYLSLQNKRSKSMIEGLGLLAGAMQKSGIPIGSRSAQPAISTRSEEARALLAEGRQNNSANSISDGGIEIARQEAELAWNLMQKSEHTLLFILKDWLSSPDGADKFLSFSDAIGFTNASTLWEKFPRSEIESLSSRMGETPSKLQSYQLVTQVYRLVQSRNAGRPDFYESLPLSFTVSASDDEIANALSTLETESICHNLILLTPERAARLMNLIPNIDPKLIVRGMASLGNMTPGDAGTHLNALKDSLANKKRQKIWDVSAHITSLYDTAALDQKTLITQAVQENSELSTKMRSKLLTFDDVLNIEKSTLLELISPFSALELAELTFSAAENHQRKIAGLLSEKMLLSVRQELERFNQKPALKRRAQSNGQKIQTELIEQMKEMIADGTLDAPESSSTPQTPPIEGTEKGAA